MRSVQPARLQAFAAAVLEAAQMAAPDAAVTAELLVEANVRGVDSHGVLRLLQYADAFAAGDVNPCPDVREVQRRGATALVDADGGYGFRPTLLAVETAVALAREHGIGLVGVRASHHFGVAGAYAMRAARQGMLAIVTTNSSPVIAPPGGTRPVVGNNPIAIAVPRAAPHEPVVVDVALSEVAYGKVRLAATEGREIPLGWARDADGQPTTDSAAALAAHSLEPVGGHKGYALALIVELLAGALTGSPVGLESNPHEHADGGVGHTVIAIDAAALVDRGMFDGAVETLAGQIADVPLAPGATAVRLPGDPELEVAARRMADGVPLSDELAQKLAALADRLGVATPEWA